MPTTFQSHSLISSIQTSFPSSFANYPPPAFIPIGRRRNSNHDFNYLTNRLFGCNPESPNAQPGDIILEDDRLNNIDDDDRGNNPNVLPINLTALRQTIEHTREIIGYPTYDVSVSLVTDSHMREINTISRGIDAPTDVLSFCFQDEEDMEPGVLGEVQFDTPDFYNLGDILIDVDYVQRKCEEDRKKHVAEKEKSDDNDGMVEGEVVAEQDLETTASDSGAIINIDDYEVVADGESSDDDEYEYMEIEVEEYDDRGVAPQMQYIYDPEIRIHMLLVHGMLHLVGYDHIEDDDYELMVVREDEVLAELRRRLGNSFGLTSTALP